MRWGRGYFAAQAAAGAVWWVAVFTVPFVRDATLGSVDPVAVAAFDVPLFVLASAVAAFGIRPAEWIATGWTVLVALALAGYATVTNEAGWGVLLMGAAAGASLLALCLVVRGRIPTEWIVAGPFGFKLAAPGPGHAAATAVQIVVMWGIFLGILPAIIAGVEGWWGVSIPLPVLLGPVGIVLLVLASGLGIWSAATMSVLGDGTPLPSAMPNKLVIAGPYRFIRNPMAVAGIVQGAAVGLILGSWLVVVYALLGSLLWNYAVRPHEERDLESRFGAEYTRYRDSVRCWIPGLPAG